VDQFGFNATYKMRLGDDGSNILKNKTVQEPTWWSDKEANPQRTSLSNG
jgi:hypothetical protein